MGASGSQNSTACPNCRAQMPFGMRFCRLCGFRLGEGVEEYTETVRFGGQAATASGAQAQGAPFGVHDWGAMAPSHASQVALGRKKRKGKGPHWIVWVILSIVLASVAGGSFMFPFRVNIGGGPGGAGSGPQQSKVGASGFSSVDGGVMIDSASPADGPVDKAGLIGGDVVTSFDGQPVKSDNDLRKQIGATPVGKPVEVLYTRDGEAKKTTLTTVSEDELERLTDIADGIPDGFLGIESFDRVPVPNTNFYGVLLKSIDKNGPAKISGLQEGDIIIEFNGTPIRTAEELGKRIDRATPYSTVKVIVMRGAERIEIPVKVGIDD
jgi:membrane-associated protease RseP (regulator of RpoE activity)